MRNCNYLLRLGRSQKQSIGVHASEAWKQGYFFHLSVFRQL